MKRLIILGPIILAVTLVVGFYLGNKISYNSSPKAIYHNPSNKLELLLDIVERDYVDPIDDDSLVELAIPHLLEQLDPHSVYIPAREITQVREPLEGNFEGIGVQFNIQNDTILIVNTIQGGPSEKIGILAGDRIITINDSVFAGVGIDNEDVIKNLKGKKGTTVDVGIARSGYSDLLEFSIKRDKIPLYSVDVSYMLDDVNGYIKISRFARTTYEEFLEALIKLKTQGMQNLVLDLRSNGGGYMDAATNIADEFLDDNQTIVYTEGKSRPRTDYFASDKGNFKHGELVVLVDSWSASASEIVAGAIQDNDRGQIVGRRTFGKGLVQEPVQFRDRSVVRLTTARYYTPTGRSIQKPYDKGTKSYGRDIMDRVIHGELSNQDSIVFADSLKFTTPGGKIVYGGGGIMPDYFVPLDTVQQSDYYKQVLSKQIVYNFALNYTDQHRKKLNSFKSVQDLENYLNQQTLFEKFTAYAAQKGVKKTAENTNAKSDELLYNLIKSYIARNILDNDGFFPIYNKNDDDIKQALKLLNRKVSHQ